jgi:hypothetical protein
MLSMQDGQDQALLVKPIEKKSFLRWADLKILAAAQTIHHHTYLFVIGTVTI